MCGADLQDSLQKMGELRIAKAFIRKVAVYAEEHAIELAAPTSEATGVGDSNVGFSQDVTPTALRIVKLQVHGVQLVVSFGLPCSSSCACLSWCLHCLYVTSGMFCFG